MTHNNEVCICILAHNEEKNIEATINSLLNNNDFQFDIIVYANGCTDKTTDIVKGLAEEYPQVKLRELEIASKINAWNKAYTENHNNILIFTDGDIETSPGTINLLHKYMETNEKISIACCESWPRFKSQPLANKLTGFMQIPLKQDFLIGHCYAVKRRNLEEYLNKASFDIIPAGVVGEDVFIEKLFPDKEFDVTTIRCYYEPPNIQDYIKYLARIRWQNEQINNYYSNNLKHENKTFIKFTRKLIHNRSLFRLILGITSTTCRLVFKAIYRESINNVYKSLGEINIDGKSILSTATRSESVK